MEMLGWTSLRWQAQSGNGQAGLSRHRAASRGLPGSGLVWHGLAGVERRSEAGTGRVRCGPSSIGRRGEFRLVTLSPVAVCHGAAGEAG